MVSDREAQGLMSYADVEDEDVFRGIRDFIRGRALAALEAWPPAKMERLESARVWECPGYPPNGRRVARAALEATPQRRPNGAGVAPEGGPDKRPCNDRAAPQALPKQRRPRSARGTSGRRQRRPGCAPAARRPSGPDRAKQLYSTKCRCRLAERTFAELSFGMSMIKAFMSAMSH